MERVYADMIGNQVTINYPPVRIVSLVPSQTELLFHLGLSDEVVGITKFCVHPADWFHNKKRIGGTKTVHIDQVIALQPDLILANKEENTRKQIEELTKLFPVWVSDIKTVNDALCMIAEVGAMTGKDEAAQTIVNNVVNGFFQLGKSNKTIRVAYFIWRKPWMCAGGDTFISDIISRIGWENVLAYKTRYPEIILEELPSLDIDLILLSSEPYPFKGQHIEEINTILPNTKVMLVDGEMFSWYGSRIQEAIQYFSELLELVGS